MQALDASSIIHGWENYPPQVFPSVWIWIEEQIASSALIISEAAYTEVGHMLPECHPWLKNVNIEIKRITPVELSLAANIKASLGIKGDDFHPKGVDENDILIIACAQTQNCQLISNEAPQPALPENLKKYKIPAVCALHSVPCQSFLDLILQANRSF